MGKGTEIVTTGETIGEKTEAKAPALGVIQALRFNEAFQKSPALGTSNSRNAARRPRFLNENRRHGVSPQMRRTEKGATKVVGWIADHFFSDD